MKRKMITLLLTLTLLSSLFTPALGEEPVTPTPPEWIKAEEYIVFSDGRAYHPNYWNSIIQLRADAAAGNRRPVQGEPLYDVLLKLSTVAGGTTKDSAANFELGLIEMMYHKNNGYPRTMDSDYFYTAKKNDQEAGGPHAEKLTLWSARSIYQLSYYDKTEEEVSIPELPGRIQRAAQMVDMAMGRNGLTTLEQFFACGTMEQPGRDRPWISTALAKERANIYVYLDGEEIVPAGGYHQLPQCLPARAENGRTLVPLRTVSEALGANVEWIQASNQIRLCRAQDEIVMTLGQTAATRNGAGFQMEVAPFAENGTTFVPVRYISEFFGQTVTWDSALHSVIITEDKARTEGSNLESWALPMGAILAIVNGENMDDIPRFGSMHRAKTYSIPTGNGFETVRVSACATARYLLESGWGITNRDTLSATVNTLTTPHQNGSQSKDQMAWDLFRVSSLAQWGYLAGFVTYSEALELVEPAAILINQTFTSWEGAYEQYLYGYHAWVGQDVTDKDIWQTVRGRYYTLMKADPATAPIFDDALFQTGVIGLPE